MYDGYTCKDHWVATAFSSDIVWVDAWVLELTPCGEREPAASAA